MAHPPGPGEPAAVWPDPAHVAAVVRVARSRPPRCGDTRVIAIDGRSGSGKTVLAAAVAAALGAPLVHMDSLYAGWDGLAAGVQKLAHEVLAPLAAGVPARFPVWDWQAGDWGSIQTVEPGPALVVEGCGASVRPAGDFASVRVWLSAPAGLRRQRALARDGATFAPYWRAWARAESALFAADRPRDRADLVLSTAQPAR